ncbi:MAG: D-alanyl-D-alanine carboxypeptidase [Rhizobiales bacterium]|nr:D-alanyl-D-alanine carboxypeptidase [Hyphomicrobiales bacterium]
MRFVPTAMLAAGALLAAACAASATDTALPPEIAAVTGAPLYAGATWGIRAVPLDSDTPVLSSGPDSLFFTGSVRKLFSVGLALDALGADHRFRTPVYRTGTVSADGVLAGDLVVVANGDLTLGGRALPDGTVAFTSFDHTESNSLGSSILTAPDPLAGIATLAAGIAASGITRVAGDVVVDDRLFEAFRVPNGNVLITPVLVNDNLVDVTILPDVAGQPAKVDWRPRSAAFTVRNEATTVAAGEETDITLSLAPDDPSVGIVSGTIAADYVPSLPGVPTLVQTFPIADPPAYLRTALIEALAAAGVSVDAAPLGANPIARLPPEGSYGDADKVAELVSAPYGQYARLILKVSHNLGANLSLMLFGLTEGARTRDAALAAERAALVEHFGLSADGFDFPTNGSGSPDSRRRILIHPFGQRDDLFPVGLPLRCLVQHTFICVFAITVASTASSVQGILLKLVFKNICVGLKLTSAVWPKV